MGPPSPRVLATSPQVEDLNAKWQRYDASRDEYVRGLHAQLQGLQAPREPERPSPPELMRKEISRLNRQLEEKINDCVEVKEELTAVRRARDAALERVQMLEQQVWPWVGEGVCGGSQVGTFSILSSRNGAACRQPRVLPPFRFLLTRMISPRKGPIESVLRGGFKSWRSRWPPCGTRRPGGR